MNVCRKKAKVTCLLITRFYKTEGDLEAFSFKCFLCQIIYILISAIKYLLFVRLKNVLLVSHILLLSKWITKYELRKKLSFLLLILLFLESSSSKKYKSKCKPFPVNETNHQLFGSWTRIPADRLVIFISYLGFKNLMSIGK